MSRLFRFPAPALWPGLALAAALAAFAIFLSRLPFSTQAGLSALTYAIVTGLVIGNSVYPRLARHTAPGVLFAKGNLLRFGVALYGFRLTFQQVASVGIAGVLTDITVLCSTFLLAVWLGRKAFGLDRDTSMLIGAGSSICGAAAVLATEPVLKPADSKVAVAVATVVVFGTLAMFLYPALWTLLQHVAPGFWNETTFGVYTGATIHEVAQVVAAGRAIGPHAADAAVVSKMIRVMMLAPFLLVLSMWLARQTGNRTADSTRPRSRIQVPFFAVAFIVCVAINSTGLIPPAVVQAIVWIDDVALACAMAALGLTTHTSAIRSAGPRPLALAAILFVWLIAGGALITEGWHLLA